jgi:hypothetical protein
MYYVRRRFVVALAVAIVATIAAVVDPKIAQKLHDDQVKADVAAGNRVLARAFLRLRLPSAFVPVPTASPLGRANCIGFGRCYRVNRTAGRDVAMMLPVAFEHIGVPPSHQVGGCHPGGCDYSMIVEDRPEVEAISVTILPLVHCNVASPQRGCRSTTTASIVWIDAD